MKIKLTLNLLYLLCIVGFSSCKKCYECSLDAWCATCTQGQTTRSFCSTDFFTVTDYKAELAIARQNSFCTETFIGADKKEICNKGIIGKTLLEADKESLEFEGYTCTLK